MTDSSDSMPAGWYYAEGDPVGTQRYWDGTQWQGEPQAAAAPETPPGGGIPTSFGAPTDQGGPPPGFGAPTDTSSPFGAAGAAGAVGGAAAGAYGAAAGAFGSAAGAVGGAVNPSGGSAGPPAEWGTRVVAYLIDIAPLIVLNIISTVIGSSAVSALISLITLGYWIWNFIYQQGTTGQTLGKGMQNIRLVSDASGQPLGIGGAFIRWLVATVIAVFTCGLGGLLDILWPLFDSDNKRLTDKILKNSVVKA